MEIAALFNPTAPVFHSGKKADLTGSGCLSLWQPFFGRMWSREGSYSIHAAESSILMAGSTLSIAIWIAFSLFLFDIFYYTTGCLSKYSIIHYINQSLFVISSFSTSIDSHWTTRSAHSGSSVLNTVTDYSWMAISRLLGVEATIGCNDPSWNIHSWISISESVANIRYWKAIHVLYSAIQKQYYVYYFVFLSHSEERNQMAEESTVTIGNFWSYAIKYHYFHSFYLYFLDWWQFLTIIIHITTAKDILTTTRVINTITTTDRPSPLN